MGQYSSAGALFFDLDGTVFYHGTNTPIGDAIDDINALYDEGYKIIFTTYRGEENFRGHPKYGREVTLAGLRENRVKYHEILWDIPSPRILINDDGAAAIRIKTNDGFSIDEIKAAVAIENSK